MKKKNTDGLQQELMDSPDLTLFLSQNQEQFVNKSVSELLNHLFEKKNISKAALAKKAGMSEIYLHQIFAGRRNPSRNRLLCLCYGLEASVEETQELLKLCGMAQLYPKLKRDAIIYYGLLHKLSLFEINDKLFDENEETLFWTYNINKKYLRIFQKMEPLYTGLHFSL